jgi:hypothetical protein
LITTFAREILSRPLQPDLPIDLAFGEYEMIGVFAVHVVDPDVRRENNSLAKHLTRMTVRKVGQRD